MTRINQQTTDATMGAVPTELTKQELDQVTGGLYLRFDDDDRPEFQMWLICAPMRCG